MHLRVVARVAAMKGFVGKVLMAGSKRLEISGLSEDGCH
jgi:hypothetical protein